jgi:C1A family cysteine protease
MQYLAKFNKVSNDVEMFNARMENFAKADKFIKEHNATESSYTVGHNQFSDWFATEYKNMLGYAKFQGQREASTLLDESANTDTVNWVTAGAVTPVKNQGSCGSCWAFSTTGSLEGAHQIATGTLLSFSEEQLVECDTAVNEGCNGGTQDEAYKYYEAGIKAELESVYPYTSGNGRSGACTYDAASATAVTVSDYTNVTPSTVSQMKAAVTQQPTAVAIQANMPCFQFYTTGVMDNARCGTNLDHAVLAVGYGTESGKDYWLVKNSWDTTWGDKGYIKLAIVDGDGICGVQMDPLYPKTN